MNRKTNRPLLATPLFLVLAFAASVLWAEPAALAQPHRDVQLYLDAGSLRTGAVDFDNGGAIIPDVRAYRAWFGETANGTNDPGFNASIGTFPSGTLLSFNILDALRKWDGSDFDAISTERLFVSLGAQNRQTPTVPDGFVAGFNIAAAASNGSYHQHINYFLTTPFSSGVYLLKIELRVGTLMSEPIYLVFNQSAPALEHEAAFAYVENVLLTPPLCSGDANGDRAVNFPDITAVLANWGSSGTPGLPGDADGSGAVAFPDITAVLANWGAPCP